MSTVVCSVAPSEHHTLAVRSAEESTPSVPRTRTMDVGEGPTFANVWAVPHPVLTSFCAP